MTPGTHRWHRAAIGGAGCYAAGSIPLLLLMATEPTPDTLQGAAWLMAIIGLLVVFSLFSRLYYLKAADARADAESTEHLDKKSAKRAAALKQGRDRTRRQLAEFSWVAVFAFSVWGLIWVFPTQVQCLIQNLMLGRSISTCLP